MRVTSKKGETRIRHSNHTSCLWIWCLFLAPVLLSSCLDWTGSRAGSRELIVITGSSTVAPLALEIGKRFESVHSEVRVDVQTGGSSRGIADVRRGLADIGMVSRPLTENESDLKAFTIAWDGICLIVHRDNPISSLTPDQTSRIYRGEITDWKEVGGRDAPITVVSKAEGRSTLELFLKHFQLKSSQIRAHVVIGDNEQGIKTVAGNPDAIGYVSIGNAEYDNTRGVPIKLLPDGGVEARVESVRKGVYPFSRPLNLVMKTGSEDELRRFLDFASSKEVHDLVERLYFVPVAP